MRPLAGHPEGYSDSDLLLGLLPAGEKEKGGPTILLKSDARYIPLKDRSIQCVVTSPPYWGLRDYGLPPSVWGGSDECDHAWVQGDGGPTLCELCEAWLGTFGLEPTPEQFVQNLVEIFREVRRVLRDDGTLWLNLGDSYATGAGQGYVPGGGGQGNRWKRKTGHWQPNRMKIPGLKPKDLIGIPWRAAFALQADGWWLRSDIVWAKKNPMPESVKDRPTRSHEYLFLLTKKSKYFYDGDAIREPYNPASASRYAYPMMDNSDIHGQHKPGMEDLREKRPNEKIRDPNPLGRNKRSVWTLSSEPVPHAHFATFPRALVEPCILAGSREGDIVLDPFCGSGTVVRVAEENNRRAVGADLAYHDISTERSSKIQKKLSGLGREQ